MYARSATRASRDSPALGSRSTLLAPPLNNQPHRNGSPTRQFLPFIVAQVRPLAVRCDPLHHPSHALFGGVHFADKAHFAGALSIRHGDGVPRLRYIDPDENFATMLHGSSSC